MGVTGKDEAVDDGLWVVGERGFELLARRADHCGTVVSIDVEWCAIVRGKSDGTTICAMIEPISAIGGDMVMETRRLDRTRLDADYRCAGRIV
jgi:hypothetical protein